MLIFTCRGKFIRCFIHQHFKECIFQFHLRSRRCVGIRISSCSRVQFPCSCKCPRNFWCNQIFRGWGTCLDSWRQAHDHRSRFGYNYFLFFLFLHLLRHRFGAAYQAVIRSAASKAEMSDVEQMKKTVSFVTCEIICGQNVCELMFVVAMHLIWILVSKLILSINQSRATLWTRHTCLIVGLLPSINIVWIIIHSTRYLFRIGSLWGVERISRWIVHRSLRTWLLWSVFPWRTTTIRSHESSAGKSSVLNPASREIIWFCWTVWNRCLLLAHSTCWQK